MMTSTERKKLEYTITEEGSPTIRASHESPDTDIYVWMEPDSPVSFSPEMADDLGNALIALATKAKSEVSA